ncbi:hypothetical protein HCN44_000445 [Aphidius gifuensis]|uniref:Uncharacterized protein n=1 Tax=Aphidius gifuensis TaxID=684658 RepID=A0A834XRW8_APHGI|nr:hypothetical protein HCN44_000445 [Aphidius gifuensis]
MFEMSAASVGPLRAYKMSIQLRIQTMTEKLLDAYDVLSKLETAENVILKDKNTYEFRFEQKNDREKIKEEEDFIDVEYNEEEEELSVLESNSSKPIEFDLNFD